MTELATETDRRAGADSLSFKGIGMIFPDGTEAVRDASFTVAKGEFVTIVGPSGCGKSTLLKIASGLLEATSGEVMVDRDRLGYVFQDATLLPWRTVLGNVELLAELHGFDRDERRRLALEA
ncbi:MAG: ATP-binding cassette domain-containing protein, partial [Ilumatobacteraceae bacterium]